MAKQTNINLLKKPGNESLDVILHWAVTGGRFIVIVTETIALAAFLYRFTLDRQIVDLNDNIKAKQAIVQALSPQESAYRSLQERLFEAKQIDQAALILPSLVDKLTNDARGKVVFSTLTLSEGGLRMEVTTSSVTALHAFIATLRTNDNLQDISIDRLETRTSEAAIAAAISAQFSENISLFKKAPGRVAPAPRQLDTGGER